MKLKAQDMFQTVETPDDLDKVLSLTIDDALTIALDHSINQELDPVWYDKLSEKLGETEVQALTSGLVDKGIKVMSSKQKHVFASAKNHILTKLQNHFIALANEQGCLYEDDYHDACYNLTDAKLIGDINTWILTAGLLLKKNKPKFETEYKKKVRDVAKHPNINKLKKGAAKETSERPELKKSFPDKMPESDLVQKKTDYPPLYGLNKVINELKDKEFKTEFLPPWGKKEAQVDDWATNEAETWLLNDEGLYNEAIDIGNTIGNNYPDIAQALEELVSGAGIMEDADLANVDWNTLAASVLEWEEVTEGLEEDGAIGQEINMYDDGHFPIGGKKAQYQPPKHYTDEELLEAEIADLEIDYRCALRDGLDDYAREVKEKLDQLQSQQGGIVEEEACLEPGRKERSKGKGRGLGKGKGKGPLGVPIRDKILSKKAQQESLLGESDLDEFFETGLEFEQAPKPEYAGDLNKFQRFQELQSKQAQGMLTPDEEVELSALAEELGPMMPALAKAYRQAQKEKKIFVQDLTKKEESPEDKKKKWVKDVLKRKEQEDLEMFKPREAQMSSGQGLEAEKQKLESQINSQFASSVESQQWIQAVHDAPDWPAVAQIWTQLFGGYIDQPQQMEQRWPDAAPEDYGMIQMQNSKDPVEASIQKSANVEFQSATTKKKVQFENASFMTHIAQTEIQKAAGLEAFNELKPNEGMLFPFDKPSHVTFHMGSVKFPIDILFLIEGPTALKVAKIIHNAQPGAFEHWSCQNTSYVLEIVGGMAKKNEIGIDSKCIIKNRIVAQKYDIATEIKKGLREQGSELTQQDIGRSLSMFEGFGRVQETDIGKRVWLKEYGFVMENDEKRDMRKGLVKQEKNEV